MRGGVVPGSGNSDTVPAMLTPGEVVISKPAVEMFGLSNLLKLNRACRGKSNKPMLKTMVDSMQMRCSCLQIIFPLIF